MTVRDLITEGLLPVGKADTVGDALSLLAYGELTQLPVVNEERHLVGMVRLATLLGEGDLSKPVGDLPFDAPFSVSEDAHLYDAIELLSEQNVDLLPVISEDGSYVGSVGLSDVLKPVARLLKVADPGSILEVELPAHDFALRHLVHAVEEGGVRILSLTTRSTVDDLSTVTVILKLALEDTSRVRAVIEHLGYRVSHQTGRATPDEELLHRVAEFMHYLEV